MATAIMFLMSMEPEQQQQNKKIKDKKQLKKYGTEQEFLSTMSGLILNRNLIFEIKN